MTNQRLPTHRAPTQAGLTLIELMIAMVITGIAVAAAMAVGFSMMSGYKEHRKMVVVERAARASIDNIASAIRNSSTGVPDGNIYDLVNCEGPAAIKVTNSANGPDELAIIHASGNVMTALRVPFGEGQTQLTVSDGEQFREGDGLLITNLAQGHYMKVTTVTDNGATWTINVEAPQGGCAAGFDGPVTNQLGFPTDVVATGEYAAGSLVFRARYSRFFVENSAATGNVPVLQVDIGGGATIEPLAEGVEDLQVAIGIDSNADGEVTEGPNFNSDEWFYNDPSDATPPVVATSPWRAIRITVIARSTFETSKSGLSTRPAAEDRDEAAASDPFRRRILSSTIEVRNLRGSP